MSDKFNNVFDLTMARRRRANRCTEATLFAANEVSAHLLDSLFGYEAAGLDLPALLLASLQALLLTELNRVANGDQRNLEHLTSGDIEIARQNFIDAIDTILELERRKLKEFST
jgi:hypothetical protein